MDFLKTLLEHQPLMTLFFTVAIGYFIGEFNIKGFSLGVGAVLFVALAAGWFAPKSAPAPMVGTLGLALFLYTVGVQYGAQFFLGLTSASGRRANLLALIGVLCAGAMSVAIHKILQLNPGYALGLFAGAGTSTAALQAAIATLGNDDAAVGYSVSYPFGVAGPILLLYLAFLIRPQKIAAATNAGLEILEIALRNPDFFGKTLAEAFPALPANVQIVAVRSAHHNATASPELVLTENDVVLAVSPNGAALAETRKRLGETAPGRMLRDRGDLDYLRVFASRASVVGRALGELTLPEGSIVAHVRRGDADIMPNHELVLEYGDRVGLLTKRSAFAALRGYFGDSIKGTAEFSYISVGLGMALGFLVGAIQLPLPGIGKLSLGLCGVLIVALVLGKVRHTGGIHWTMPLPANLVVRNLGLTIFLAQVGMSSGPRFAATVSQTGLLMLGLGALVLLALVVPILILGLLVYRLPFDEVAGIVTGACGNPAILAFANKLTPTDKPDIGYAMIFPAMTIVKILFVDILPAIW
ncbi:TrkA C-terminal domain-containing protein [Paraburkholderia sediminicola]|uniref:TrkA C-terminal domain-containing protein n=1 Tax=Paraburkholderia rhynchosiae TaxID=487049 RepID=A0ACC7ND14_9BURK